MLSQMLLNQLFVILQNDLERAEVTFLAILAMSQTAKDKVKATTRRSSMPLCRL
jgi:hypothetical protein